MPPDEISLVRDLRDISSVAQRGATLGAAKMPGGREMPCFFGAKWASLIPPLATIQSTVHSEWLGCRWCRRRFQAIGAAPSECSASSNLASRTCESLSSASLARICARA